MAADEDGPCAWCGGPLRSDSTQTGCLYCGGTDREPAGAAEPVAALRKWYGLLCPRCGSDRAVSFGAQYSCGRCGAVWQA